MQEKILGVDMEYFSCLTEGIMFRGFSLIQISTLAEIFLIDSITLKNDLQGLRAVLENPEIIKVLHGCSEDLKILYQYLQIECHNFVDTLVLHSEIDSNVNQIGLKQLCLKYLNIELDKTLQQSYFNMRPLPHILQQYASLDAFLVLVVFLKILQEEERGKINKGIEKTL